MPRKYNKSTNKSSSPASNEVEKKEASIRGGKDQPARRERSKRTAAAQTTQDNRAREFRYSHFDSETDNQPKRYKALWREFVSDLSHFDVRESKLGGEAFSPAIFENKRRSKANVIELSMLVLDYDHDITIDEARGIWEAQGCAYALYTSHSHQRITDKHPTPEDCFRVVIPLREPITVEEFPFLWEWAKRLSEEKLDPACKDASRIYFFPAVYSQDSPREFHEEKGEFLNWRPIVEDERGRQETEEEKKTKREATPRPNESAVASVKLTLDDITYDESNPFEVWKAELGVKISADSTAKLNPEGNIDCRAYCHRGTGVTGLFFNPQTNGVICNAGCDLKRIGQAFDMPKMPHKRGAQTEHSITPRTDFSHDGVLKDILVNLPTDVDFADEAGVSEAKHLTREHLYVITVKKVIEVAKALGCGLAKHLDFVYQFNGQFWKQIEKDEMTHFLGESAERLGVKWTTAQSHLFRDALLRQFLSAYFGDGERQIRRS